MKDGCLATHTHTHTYTYIYIYIYICLYIFEATPNKTAAVWTHTYHLKNDLS